MSGFPWKQIRATLVVGLHTGLGGWRKRKIREEKWTKYFKISKEKNRSFSCWVVYQYRLLSSGKEMLNEKGMRYNFNQLFHANSTSSEMNIIKGLAPFSGAWGIRLSNVPKPCNNSLLAPSCLLLSKELIPERRREGEKRVSWLQQTKVSLQYHPSLCEWSPQAPNKNQSLAAQAPLAHWCSERTWGDDRHSACHS